MKATAITTITVALLTLTSTVAQDARQPRKRVVLPANPTQTTAPARAVAARPQATEATTPALLTENITVSLNGTVGDDVPIDVALTGAGAEITAEFILAGGEVPSIASVNYGIRKVSGRFTVNYSIGFRFPVKHGDRVQFQEAMLSNTVFCEPGKPVEIYRSGERTLTLTLAPAKSD